MPPMDFAALSRRLVLWFRQLWRRRWFRFTLAGAGVALLLALVARRG
jgi:hypothetical protein